MPVPMKCYVVMHALELFSDSGSKDPCLNWPSESDLDEEANKYSPSYYNSDNANKQKRFEEWQRWDKVIIQNTDMSEGQTVSGKKTCRWEGHPVDNLWIATVQLLMFFVQKGQHSGL